MFISPEFNLSMTNLTTTAAGTFVDCALYTTPSNLKHLNSWFTVRPVWLLRDSCPTGSWIAQVGCHGCETKLQWGEKRERSPLKPFAAGCISVHCVNKVQKIHNCWMKTCSSRAWEGKKAICWRAQKPFWRHFVFNLSSLFQFFFFYILFAQLCFGCEITSKAAVRLI